MHEFHKVEFVVVEVLTYLEMILVLKKSNARLTFLCKLQKSLLSRVPLFDFFFRFGPMKDRQLHGLVGPALFFKKKN